MQSLRFARYILLLLASSSMFTLAQTPPPASTPRATRPARRIGQEPCWQEAGVARAAIAQRRGIERNTKIQVASVCADASLSTQQKRAKIREIRQRARQQMEALVSPEQQEAIRSCEASRSGEQHAGSGAHRAKGAGPCGEMPAPPTATPPPNSPPQP